jgi:hypothetical protein
MQGSRDPHKLIPLLTDECDINGAADHRVEAAVMLRAVQLVELLFGQREPRHQAIAQEMTEAKELVGEAMLIDKMFFGPEDRMVIQQAVQDIEGFADRTRNDLRMEDALLIGNMGVDGHRTIVIALVTNGVSL